MWVAYSWHMGFVRMTQADISLFTQSFHFPKASLQVPMQSKSTSFCISSLECFVKVSK